MKQCLLCLDPSNENFCPPCLEELPWVTQTCPRCGRAEPRGLPCALCAQSPCPWDRGLAPLSFEEPIGKLVSGLKFSRRFYCARVLSELFIQKLPPGPRPQLLLPVPLHPWRMLSRGFNQSTELTRLLSQTLGIPYSPDYLKRLTHNRAQRQSNKKSRQSNMNRAFALTRPLPVTHLALIDDVLTTGETLSALCRAIRAVQPEIVIEVWTMAQTVLRK